ncbi:hypothetical protein SKAU_G00396840 [Synaphobranchus kaupii]|uniref:Uncharacterized protein n=1 Tax=Synaphobranchus kaupii TaxID=118154 RepID=A0A9Q1ECM3_SYNKA|nr:hypothetical protein SKAU_G00396840 [Synaphobranchus kaupii]
MLEGDQARKFFLQSGLPSPVLAEIWALADMNKDGKMDRLEFSIAMKLIKMKLQGQSLPTSLPIIMKQPPMPSPSPMATSSARFGMGSMPNLSIMPTMPILAPVPMTTSMTLMSTMGAMGPLMPAGLAMPLLPSLGTPTLPNGPAAILQPTPVAVSTTLPLSSSFSSSLGFGGAGMTKTQSLLDLGSSR